MMFCKFVKNEDGKCYCELCDQNKEKPEDCNNNLILRPCNYSGPLATTNILKKYSEEQKQKIVLQEPTLISKIKNYSQAISRHVFSGFEKRSQEEIDRLLNVCKRCVYFKNDTCSICGCAINRNPNAFRNKLAMASEQCPIGKWKFEEIKQYNAGKIINLKLLTEDTIYALKAFPVDEIDCVVGVSRSGLLPATIIATCLHTRLFAAFKEKIVECPSGFRMIHDNVKDKMFKNVLVVDDSAVSGGSLLETAEKVMEEFKNIDKIYTCAIYCHTNALRSKIDFPVVHLPLPHIFEWNIMNSVYCPEMGIDFDGVLCPDVPVEIVSDKQKHLEYIKNVKPLNFLPRRQPVKFIATGRPEEFREVTEWWLKKYNIKYERLYMYPGSIEERDKNFLENVINFKIDIIKQSNVRFFLESDKIQAEGIQKNLGKQIQVICFN